MPWFRSLVTGREFTADGRWAEAHRQNADVVEIETPGAPDPEPSPVRESDPALSKLRKADLQAALAAMGESTEGTKAELAARLARADGEPA